MDFFLYLSCMKKLLFILLLLSQIVFAQTPENLKNQFKTYITATNTLDADNAYTLTYPVIFEKISISDLKEMYKSFNQNPNFNIKTTATQTPVIFENIIENKGKKFVKITSENQVIMTFKTLITDSKSMINEFKTNMNAKSVLFNEKSNSFTIIHNITVIGIQDNLTKNNWNFINYSPRKNVIKEIFGTEVSNQLKL